MNDRILSSLPLQVLLYVNEKYTRLWLLVNFSLFWWKAYKLFYTASALRWELALVFLLPLLDACRVKVATRGNKTEQVVPLIQSVLLAAPAVMGYVFFLRLQTYVLHIDLWLNSFPLVLLSLEVLLSLFSLLVFKMAYR